MYVESTNMVRLPSLSNILLFHVYNTLYFLILYVYINCWCLTPLSMHYSHVFVIYWRMLYLQCKKKITWFFFVARALRIFFLLYTLYRKAKKYGAFYLKNFFVFICYVQKHIFVKEKRILKKHTKSSRTPELLVDK